MQQSSTSDMTPLQMAIELERYASLLRQKLEREASGDVIDMRQLWAVRQKKLKSEHRNYGMQGKEADDAELVHLLSCGLSVIEISKRMGRNRGAITSRIKNIHPIEARSSTCQPLKQAAVVDADGSCGSGLPSAEAAVAEGSRDLSHLTEPGVNPMEN
jgi:hypothetical protein